MSAARSDDDDDPVGRPATPPVGPDELDGLDELGLTTDPDDPATQTDFDDLATPTPDELDMAADGDDLALSAERGDLAVPADREELGTAADGERLATTTARGDGTATADRDDRVSTTERVKGERTPPRQFLREVRGELRRVNWPSRREVASYSVVVLVTVTLVTAYIFGLDQAFGQFVLLIFG